MKDALDPEYADWVKEGGGECTVFTGVVLAVTLTLVPAIIPILDVFACATTLDGGDWIKVTVAGSAIDSVGEWLKVLSLQCLTLGFESWRFELELNLMQYWMI